MEYKTSSGITDWPEICKEAVLNQTIFNNFRKFDVVKLTVDGYPKLAAVSYLLKLIKKLNFNFLLKIWSEIDGLMIPDTYIMYKNNKIFPATGRHLVNVTNYIDIFDNIPFHYCKKNTKEFL